MVSRGLGEERSEVTVVSVGNVSRSAGGQGAGGRCLEGAGLGGSSTRGGSWCKRGRGVSDRTVLGCHRNEVLCIRSD